MRRGIGIWVSVAAGLATLLAMALVARSCSSGGSEFAGSARNLDVTFAPSPVPATPLSSVSPTPVVLPTAPPGLGGSGSRPHSGSSAAASAQPSGPVVCPSGHVSAVITDFSSDERSTEPDPDTGRRKWDVQLRGTVRNDTSKAVQNVKVTGIVHASDGRSDTETTVISSWIAPGSSAPWVTHHLVNSVDEPKEKESRVSVGSWSWGEAYAKCPT